MVRISCLPNRYLPFGPENGEEAASGEEGVFRQFKKELEVFNFVVDPATLLLDSLGSKVVVT